MIYLYESLADIDYEIVNGKNGKYRNELLSDTIFCFDIEDTSYYIDNDLKITTFDYDDPDRMKLCTKGSLCYHWQFSVNDTVFTGRELRDFPKLLESLNKCCPARKIIYVHFLSHEFQFLLNIFKFDDVFARNAHKPITAYIAKYNVEFRCSYTLTRLSLDTWSKNLPVKKLKGNLDYDVLRTPLTPLTEKEIAYCINDVLVMYHGIKAFKGKYQHVYNIPLTQTGEVRRVVKQKLSKSRYWLECCQRTLPKTIEEFKDEIHAFIGGSVIANFLYKDTTVSNVMMKDISSSYPWVMLSEKYPDKPFKKITSGFNYYIDNPDYAYLIHFTAKNVEAKTNCKFLSKSKLLSFDKVECDNGRVIRSAELSVILTNIDYELFNRCYSADITINYMKISTTRYLPNEFRKYILELYCNKTTLKGISGQEELYMQSKQFVNSLFGMMVTKDISDDIIFDGELWSKDELTIEKFIEKIDIKKRSLSKNFLSFQFGIWVTAYARRNLWNAILALDEYVVYCDTDSVKYLSIADDSYFDEYNADVLGKYEILANDIGVPTNMFYPKSPKGKVCYIGVFDTEDACIDKNGNIQTVPEFRALGAKKYIYRDRNDNELHMTVAGVSKKAVKCLNNDISNFETGTTFTEKDLKNADAVKLTPYYLNDIDEITFPDGYKNTYKYGINLMPTTYNLSITPSDLLLLFNLWNDRHCNLLET